MTIRIECKTVVSLSLPVTVGNLALLWETRGGLCKHLILFGKPRRFTLSLLPLQVKAVFCLFQSRRAGLASVTGLSVTLH